MTTPNYHPTSPKVAPRSEKPKEPSSSKPASANPEMKENGMSEKPTKEKSTPEKPTWYYEEWRVHQFDSTISYASRLRPLIQNWWDENAQKYVDDLLRPFNPPPVGTPVKPKIDGQDKALIGRVLADLEELSSIVREASAQQFDRMCNLEKNGRVP
ncbi:hypothetical protein D1007_12380 [Hordeum vulgare]|nr:hypothetical protein D1007_12380 [Hordeum vulgare]